MNDLKVGDKVIVTKGHFTGTCSTIRIIHHGMHLNFGELVELDLGVTANTESLVKFNKTMEYLYA